MTVGGSSSSRGRSRRRMARALATLSLVALLPLVASAASVHGVRTSTAPDQDWLVQVLPVAPEDWTQTEDGWTLQYGGSLTGLAPGTTFAFDIVLVRDGWPVFGFRPLVAEGTGVASTGEIGTSAAPQDGDLLVLTAATTEAGAASATLQVGGGSVTLREVSPTASGGGARIETRWGPMPVPVGLATHVEGDLVRAETSPALWFGEVALAISPGGAGTGVVHLDVNGVERHISREFVGIGEGHQIYGVSGSVTGRTAIHATLDGLAAGSHVRTSEVAIPVDAVAVGLAPQAYVYSGAEGSGFFATSGFGQLVRSFVPQI